MHRSISASAAVDDESRRGPSFARAVDLHPILTVVLVALANLALKVPGIARRSLWLDEAWTVSLGMQTPAAIVFASTHDENPPLYILFMAGWFQLFGTSEVAVRLPTLLASVACAVLLLLFVRRFYGAEAAVYASLLYLVSASQTKYATEGRCYAIVGLLCVVSFHLYLSNLELPRWPKAIALGVVNAAALYTHYTIGLAYVVQGLCALAFARRKRRAFLLYVTSQLMALALFAPFVPFPIANLPKAGVSWLAPPDLATLYWVVRELVGSKSALRFGLALVTGSLLLRVLERHGGKDRRLVVREQHILVVAAWAIVPILLAFVVSQRSPILYARYELFAGLGWMALIAALLAALPWPAWSRIVAALLFVLLSAKESPYAASRDPEWRAVAAIARPAVDERSAIVVVPAVECIPFAYYAAPDALPFLFDEYGQFDPAGLHAQLAAHRIFCRDADGAQSDLALTQDRVVMILSHVDDKATERILQDLAARGYAPGEPQRIAGKAIYLLTSTPTPFG